MGYTQSKKPLNPTISVEPSIDHKGVSLLRPPYPTFQRVKVSEEEVNHCCPLWSRLK